MNYYFILIVLIATAYQHNPFLEQFMPAIQHLGDSNACMKKIQSILTETPISPVATNFLLYSSHMVNDLGDYASCINSNDSNYALLKMKFNPNFPSMADLAFCGPKECTLDDYYLLRPYLFQLVVYLLNSSGIPLHNQSFNVTEDKLIFKFPKEVQDNTKVSYGFYITIAITAILLIVVLVATYLERTGRKLADTSILGCWSLQKNLVSLFNTKNPVDENLNVFNGMRFLMMCWIVIGHSFSSCTIAPTPNFSDLNTLIRNNIWMTFITSASFTVDVFFAISGFLCALSMTKAFTDQKNRNAKVILLSYLGRLIRLMPLVIFAILMFVFIMPTLFSSPISEFWEDYRERCTKYGWYTIFFINNFFGGENLCINPSWYLSNDVQFFFLTPLFVIPYVLNRKIGLIVTFATMIASMVIQSILIGHYELSTSLFKPSLGNEFSIFYSKPYNRINTYLIGVIVAWVYLSYKDAKYKNETFDKISKAFKENSLLRSIIFIFSTVLMIALIMLNYFFDHYLDTTKTQNILYMVLSRPLFVICTFLVVYPVILGKGRPLYSVFAAPFMAPLAKLTYGTYLIHYPILITELLSVNRYLFTTPRLCFMRGLHLILISYVWSLMAGMLIETPMLKLERILLFPKKLEVHKASKELEYKEVGIKPKDEETTNTKE